MMEKYTDENVYWLYYGGENGERMITKGNETGSPPVPDSYRDLVHTEQSNIWKTTLFAGEDTWYWDKISVYDIETRTYTMTLSAPAVGDYTAILRGEIVAENYDNSQHPDHSIRVYINDEPKTERLISDTWDGEEADTYKVYLPQIFKDTKLGWERWDGKGAHTFEVQIPQDQLLDGENRIKIVAENITGGAENLYFNWVEIEFNRQFKAFDNRIWFAGENEGTWNYVVDGFEAVGNDNYVGVYDITDPLNPGYYWGSSFSEETGTLSFKVTHENGLRFFVGVAEDVSPTRISNYQPPPLNTPAEYVFITHRNLITATQVLADYRASQGMSTLVVNIEDLYNQFNYGIYHPIAIKNFLAHTFDPQNWSEPPTYVLLVGDGHWNFKGYPNYDSPKIYMPPNLTWVDPWQGEVDSANLLATIIGDNSPVNDPLPDVLIGRLPVNSPQQLQAVVDKITLYESTPMDEWQRHLMFVADNPDDAGNFSDSAEAIIAAYRDKGIIPDRIYLEDYFDDQGQCNDPDPDDSRSCPEVNDRITDDLNHIGALFMNYYGHASINRWAAEQIFINEDIPALSNSGKLPIVFSADCLDGYWDYPNLEFLSRSGSSLIEELVRSEGDGAVAAFSPTGLGVATGHDFLQDGFYDAFYIDEVDRLGLLSLAAKLRLYEAGVYSDLLHTFTVFGDPALLLPPAY